MSNIDIFNLFDKNNDGSLDFEEFIDLVKYMNIDMTQHKAMKMFLRSAGPDRTITSDEFDHAMKSLNKQVTSTVLSTVGLSTKDLIYIFTVSVALLLTLFVFIFLGIAAFSVDGAFGSVINSLMPIMAAMGVGTSSGDLRSFIKNFNLEDLVQKVLDMLKNAGV